MCFVFCCRLPDGSALFLNKTLKYKKPDSIYELSKILNRPFKATWEDVKLLERFGFITLIEQKTKKRIRHKPKISVDEMVIKIKI